MRKKITLVMTLLLAGIPMSMEALEKKMSNDEIKPMVVQQVLEEVKKNNNWKKSLATGKHAQIVFMSVSPATNPKNEIGMEVHSFDQVILIVEGKGQAILDGKTSFVGSGDMIFIPEGVAHNVVNLDTANALKLLSFYSENDIPKDTAYKKQADQPSD